METIEKTSIEIDEALLAACEEKKHTIVHCKVQSYGGPVRVWKTTRLEDIRGGRAALLFALGVSVYPNWSYIERADGYSYFTLIFEALPAEKAPFILLEDIPEPSGFFSPQLLRQNSEVYNTELFSI